MRQCVQGREGGAGCGRGHEDRGAHRQRPLWGHRPQEVAGAHWLDLVMRVLLCSLSEKFILKPKY